MKFKTLIIFLFLSLTSLVYSNQTERIRFTDIDFYSVSNVDFNLTDTLVKNGKLILDYKQANRFRITYVADSLKAVETVKYKIEGFDYDWISGMDCHQIMLTNLLAGRYTVRVGIFDDQIPVEEISMDLVITPPFWETWTFKAIKAIGFYGLIGAVIIILVINNSRLKKKNH